MLNMHTQGLGATVLCLAICSIIFTQAKLSVIYSSEERGPKL